MRYYYDDVLKAAWMAQEFGVKFDSPDSVMVDD